MIDWIFVLVQKDSNTKKESYGYTDLFRDNFVFPWIQTETSVLNHKNEFYLYYKFSTFRSSPKMETNKNYSFKKIIHDIG